MKLKFLNRYMLQFLFIFIVNTRGLMGLLDIKANNFVLTFYFILFSNFKSITMVTQFLQTISSPFFFLFKHFVRRKETVHFPKNYQM